MEHFYLREQVTGKLWLFRLGYLADIFSKMDEVSLFLQDMQLTVFFSNAEI